MLRLEICQCYVRGLISLTFGGYSVLRLGVSFLKFEV